MTRDAPASIDEKRLWLGIDVGTSRLKAGVYDARLKLVHESSLDTRSLAGARQGQLNAASLWRALQRQLVDLLKATRAERIAAVGITGMAESGCLIDADAHPVTPMLLWHDRRGIRQAAALRRKADAEFASVTGLKTTSVRSIAKWMWMTDHGAPREARWCGAPEWIALCLTGNWLTDATLAVRSGVFCVLEGEYSERLLKLAGAHSSLFPPVRSAPANAGRILASVARALGLPPTLQVVIAGHDDIVAAYGAGAKPGDLIDSGGTAEGLLRIMERAPRPAQTVGARMAMARFFTPGTWALLAGAGSTGALMQLAAEMLESDPAALDQIAAGPGKYPDGTIDVRLSKNALPSIKIMKGAPPAEVWSAVLDLVCDSVNDAAVRLESIAGPAARLVLIGGAARSRELVRRKSERLALPALALAEIDATTRGAAALASLAGDQADGHPTAL
jgi:sugar (pentulose or hexulose) kinase